STSPRCTCSSANRACGASGAEAYSCDPLLTAARKLCQACLRCTVPEQTVWSLYVAAVARFRSQQTPISATASSGTVDGSGAVAANVTTGAGVTSVAKVGNAGCAKSMFTTSKAPLGSLLGIGVPSDCSSANEN